MSSRLVSCIALAAGLALPSCGGDESGGAANSAPTKAELACQALVGTITGCSAPTACEQALADDCASVAGMLGDPYLDAFDACLDGGGDPASCALEAGVGLTPTPGQHAFAESFCNNCALGVPGCVDLLFGGENAELAPIAAIAAPLSDDLVGEIAKECTSGLTCLATFQSCAQGVIARRAIPEETLGCFVGMLLGTEQGSVECGQDGSSGGGPGGGGEGGASGGAGVGAGGAGATGAGGSGGGGAGGGQGGEPACALDPSEPNETLQDAKAVPGGGDGILGDCEGDESLSGVLAGAGDADWRRYHGTDAPCGLDDIQPHASVEAGYPVKVCVYVDPVGDSDPPTCMTGAPASAGSFVGCCGDGAARLAFGGNLENDDADVRISLSTLADICVDYQVTYGFGTGP